MNAHATELSRVTVYSMNGCGRSHTGLHIVKRWLILSVKGVVSAHIPVKKAATNLYVVTTR